MDITLKDRLLAFKLITEVMIEDLKKEEYDNLEEFLDKRANIINEIDNQAYSDLEFKTFSQELLLMELEQEINKLLSEKKQKVRSEMDKVSTVKKANNNYQRNSHPDSLFFNKKI